MRKPCVQKWKYGDVESCVLFATLIVVSCQGDETV